MAKPNKPSNKIMKAKEAQESLGGELIPPSLGEGGVEKPKQRIKTLGDISDEQDRLYGLVFEGMLHISDYTKLMYGLGQMSNVIKNKAELDALEDAYIKQWQGVRIIAPEGEEIPDHMQQAIEGEIIDA